MNVMFSYYVPAIFQHAVKATLMRQWVATNKKMMRGDHNYPNAPRSKHLRRTFKYIEFGTLRITM